MLLLTTLSVLTLATPAPQEPAAPETLTVATKVAEPFAFRAEAGEWTGLTVELWELVAGRMKLESSYEELELTALLDAVAAGEADVGVAALTVTAEREERLDFSHTVLTSGLGIAMQRSRGSLLVSVVRRLVSLDFLKAVGALAAILITFGFLIWLFERKRNSEEFGGPGLRGLGEGFWWSAVTMTTVGYGDRSPRTPGGRLVALVWMFASIILISGFTASIATSLTIGQLGARIRGAQDLPGKRVGCVAGSTGETWLDGQRIEHVSYPDVRAAVDALGAEELDAVVHDLPILQFQVKQNPTRKLAVLEQPLDRQDYAFAFPGGSPLRERVNRELLAVLGSREWDDLVFRYLGGR